MIGATNEGRVDALSALVQQMKLLVANDARGGGAESRIAELLADIEVTDLPRLDYEMRWRADWQTTAWDEMKPAEAARLVERAHDSVLVGAALSMHGNGHVRELAVRHLARIADAASLPWLTLRCGDWVSVVRDAARTGVERWLFPGHAHELVGVLPLLDGGRFAAGRPASGLAANVHDVLRHPDSLPAVLAQLDAPSRALRRSCIRLALESVAPFDVFIIACGTGDVVSIGLALRRLPSSGPHNVEVGRLLLRSPDARFRFEGLWRLLREPVADHADLVERGLRDRAASVRDVAQRWCRDHGDDPRRRYREHLGKDPHRALLGLGDLGSPQDLDTAQAFLDHPSTPVRVATVRLLTRVGRPEDRALFAERIVNAGAKERREAISGLRRAGCTPTMLDQLLERALERGDIALLRCVLYQVAPGTSRWQRLAIGLRVAALGGEIGEVGIELLRRTVIGWHTDNHHLPNLDKTALRRDLDAARPGLEAASMPFSRQHLLRNIEHLVASL